MRVLIAVCIAWVSAASLGACASGPTNTKIADGADQKAKNLDEAARREALKKEIEANSTLLLNILGTTSDRGTLDNIFADGDVVVLDEALEGARGTGLGSGGGFGMGGGGGGAAIGGVGGRIGRASDEPHQISVIALDTPDVSGPGTLETKLLEIVIARMEDDLTSCHRVQLREEGAMKAGSVTITLQIDAYGKTVAASASNSTLPENVSACLEERFSEASFPAPSRGAVELQQTIHFDVDVSE